MRAELFDIDDEIADDGAETRCGFDIAAIGYETHGLFSYCLSMILSDQDMPSELLPAFVVAEGFLAVEAERMHDGQVVERKQAGIVAGRRVGVLVPGP